ncbi:MAG: hypothetical protein H6706_24590 [Myxococcales bacterium]|nr:hypothetical protein [Myxococcales bacterium]
MAALAQPAQPRNPLYTGAFRGLLVGGGAVAEGPGLAFTLGARASSVLHLADVEARYQLSDVEAGTTHQGYVTAHLHPLFLFLLANNRLGWALGSLSLRLGGGPAYRAGEGTGLVWEWGGGFDVPLTAPDAGRSFWLGASVTRTSDLAYEVLDGEVATHLLLRLEYRLNDL